MLIDARTPEEFSFGTIPGAVNIPLDGMRGRLSEIPDGQARRTLLRRGFAGISGATYPDGARLP